MGFRILNNGRILAVINLVANSLMYLQTESTEFTVDETFIFYLYWVVFNFVSIFSDGGDISFFLFF